jgi:hypothetical protein
MMGWIGWALLALFFVGVLAGGCDDTGSGT